MEITVSISLLLGIVAGRTVDLHLAVGDNRLDQTLLLQLLDALAGERAVDLQSIDERSDGDETVRLDILVELVGSGLVEQDGVLCLVLNLALGPLFADKSVRYCPHNWQNSDRYNYLLLLLLRSSVCGRHDD